MKRLPPQEDEQYSAVATCRDALQQYGPSAGFTTRDVMPQRDWPSAGETRNLAPPNQKVATVPLWPEAV
jgi:hypothetical protein